MNIIRDNFDYFRLNWNRIKVTNWSSNQYWC